MLFAPTTNAASLHVEANEMPIALRHIRLSMQYVVKTLYVCIFVNVVVSASIPPSNSLIRKYLLFQLQAPWRSF